MISAAVKLAQQRLAALGFSVGKAGADGKIGNDTRAALRAFQKGAGMPVSGLLTDATMQALAKPTAAPPTPRPRPEPDRLGTGNTDTRPRLRPDDAALTPRSGTRGTLSPFGQAPDIGARPDQTGGGLMSLENAQLQEARANLNPDVQFAPGMDFNTRFALAQTGNARTREANAQSGPLRQERTGPPPSPSIGTMIPTPFAQRWDNAPSPQSVPPQVAQQALAPPAFTPTPDNPGVGLPGMPPRASFGEAAGDVGGILNQIIGITPANGGPPPAQDNAASEDEVRQAITKSIIDALIKGLRIEPQPNQNAYSDQFSTASPPPPPFTTPSGMYR